MKIETLNLSVRAYNCLKHAGIDTVEQVRNLSDDDLYKIRNLSKKNAVEIRQALAAYQATNADRLRSMSDEELAEWLTEFAVEAFAAGAIGFGASMMDKQQRLAWLQQPAEGAGENRPARE